MRRAPLSGAAALWGLLGLAWLWAPQVLAGETFPGQNDLAAGLTCHNNLDMVCARSRLEKALAKFSPEQDPDFLDHVRTARWVLTQIHVAADDLRQAEQQLLILLRIDPGFGPPPGDHPPKLLYVLEQARAHLAASRTKDLPEGQPQSDPRDDNSKKVKPNKTKPTKPPTKKPEPKTKMLSKPPPVKGGPDSKYSLAATVRLNALFGSDAQLAGPGPGAGLRFAWRAVDQLWVDLSYDYAYHPLDGELEKLQTMSLSLGGRYQLDFSDWAVRLGASLGTLAAGTEDRYDNWGLVLSASLAAVWPAGESWGLRLEIQPSLAVIGSGTSFFLPVGLAGEVRF